MEAMRAFTSFACFLLGATAVLAAEYNGPRPPKADTLYLMHADNLVELDSTTAKQDSKKDDVVYTVPGTAANAKTPLAEPIFLIKSDKISPESIEMYKFDVKNGHRELTLVQKRRRGGPRPVRITVTRLEKGLYKLEASETLENGEYGLSPTGSNQVFCFSIY